VSGLSTLKTFQKRTQPIGSMGASILPQRHDYEKLKKKKTIAKESQALQKKMFQMANEAKQKAMQREIENNTEKSNDTGL